MSQFVVRTIPKGFKTEGTVNLTDLTVELLVTNDPGTAQGSVDGSKRPMAAWLAGAKLPEFSNLARINGDLLKISKSQASSVPRGGFTPPSKPSMPTIARFGKMTMSDFKSKREATVERV